MEKIRFGNKLVDIISKNPKLSKRAASTALAIMLASSPVIGTVHAEGEQEAPTIRLVQQEAPTTCNMTMADYESGVINAYMELSKHINYEHMMADIQSAYYLTNYEYISDELEAELVSNGYITETDMVNAEGKFTRDNPEGWINVDNFNSLSNTINDYNESQIHLDYHGDGVNAEHYIDPSVLCYDEHDREDAHELFEKWVKAYNLEPGTIMSNDWFMQAHKQLTHLNAAEQQSELWDASIGARFMMLKTTGKDLMQFERDYMLENYEYSDLDVYFKPDELRQRQMFLRDDFEINECLTELDFCATIFGEHYHFCLDEVNKALFSLLKTDELRKDAAAEQAPALHK